MRFTTIFGMFALLLLVGCIDNRDWGIPTNAKCHMNNIQMPCQDFMNRERDYEHFKCADGNYRENGICPGPGKYENFTMMGCINEAKRIAIENGDTICPKNTTYKSIPCRNNTQMVQCYKCEAKE